MKIKAFKISFSLVLLTFLTHGESFSQDQNFSDVEYVIIAEGLDSPIPNLQVVCFNQYFNQDYLPAKFRSKYQINRPDLYKKKMLVELFHSDKDGEGLDKIELIRIREEGQNLVIEYNVINSDKENDDQSQAPFLIVQVPKSKKAVKYIQNGKELGTGKAIYVDK